MRVHLHKDSEAGRLHLPHVLEATILTGPGTNKELIIPVDMPFEFKRLQFPVKLSFAITIKRSQGQSLGVVGLYLEFPCFSHGQLYVFSSRVGSAQNLFIFVNNGKTRNIIYPLQHCINPYINHHCKSI